MEKKSEQLNLLNVVWIGFSFIAGITFTASFSDIVAKEFKSITTVSGVGINILWIYIIEGFVAFMCAWSFAKLVSIHPEANGGGAQYTRTAFGKFWGLFMNILNYSVIPVITTALIVTMIRQNFMGGRFNLSPSKGYYWSSLYLDLIGYFLYFFAATIIFLGIKKYKKVAMGIGYMTWGLTIMLMVFGLIAGFLNLGNNSNGLKIYSDATLNYKTFSNAFTSSFFSFCGIETFISTGKNIKNRSKTMPTAIIIIMILTTVFYILFTFIVMFAVTNGFAGNPNLQIFDAFNSKFLRLFGPILIIVCTILMRFNSSIQITIFGGATLEPLASQRFLSTSFRKENKENIPVKAVWLTIIISTITFAIFVIIPDIIQGITKKESPFNFTTLSSASSIILITIYLIIISVSIYQGINKKMKVNIFEYVAWFLTMGTLFFILVVHFIGLFSTLINPYNSNGEFLLQNVLACIFQLAYMLLIILLALFIYFIYHPKQLAKIKDNVIELKELKKYERIYRIVPTNCKKETKFKKYD